jgi:hypothetical protein
MNKEQIRAINDRVSFLEDNCYRYEMERKRGLGSPQDEAIIADHKRKIAELKEGL